MKKNIIFLSIFIINIAVITYCPPPPWAPAYGYRDRSGRNRQGVRKDLMNKLCSQNSFKVVCFKALNQLPKKDLERKKVFDKTKALELCREKCASSSVVDVVAKKFRNKNKPLKASDIYCVCGKTFVAQGALTAATSFAQVETPEGEEDVELVEEGSEETESIDDDVEVTE